MPRSFPTRHVFAPIPANMPKSSRCTRPISNGARSRMILKAPRRCSRTATRTCVKWPWRKCVRPRTSWWRWSRNCSACCCPRTPTTGATCFSRFAPERVATKRRSFRAICFACIRATRKSAAGGWRSFPRTKASTAGTRKSSPASRARTCTASSSSSPARTVYSASPKPNPRAASTPRPAPWRFCRSRMNKRPSRSTQPTCAWTPTARPARAVST